VLSEPDCQISLCDIGRRAELSLQANTAGCSISSAFQNQHVLHDREQRHVCPDAQSEREGDRSAEAAPLPGAAVRQLSDPERDPHKFRTDSGFLLPRAEERRILERERRHAGIAS
jgi:hypothetical protein